jgi:hypothetical protein
MQTQSIIPFPKAEQAPRVLNCLELFAGIRSFGKVAQQFGHRVFSSDFNPLLEDINYCVDIMQFDPAQVPFVPDFVWASPNCATYSIAACTRHREKSNRYQPKTPAALDGDKQVKKTLELLDYFLQQNPQMIFFIENPVGYLQFMSFMQTGWAAQYKCLENARLITIDQCQYGREFQKPTHLWTNSRDFIPRARCTHKGKEGCHILNGFNNTSSGVTSGSYYKRAMLPAEIFHDIFNQI